MPRWLGDFSLFLTVVAAGVVMVLAAGLDPSGFPTLGSWIALLGFVLTAAVIAGSVRGRAPQSVGLLPLGTGFVLLGAAVAVTLLPGVGEAISGWTRGRVHPGALPVLFQACGALGVALGFLLWTNRLIRRAVEAEERDGSSRTHVSDLERRLREHERLLETARSHDEVTATLNRQAFLRRLDEVVQRDSRLSRPFAFVLVNVVGYRSLTTAGRHTEADQLLKHVSTALLASTRGTDHTGRISEDQFAVVLGECENARPAVDRLLLALNDGPTVGEDERKVQIRVAVVSVPQPHFDVSPSELFRLAAEGLANLRGSAASLCAHRTLEPRRPRRAAM